MLISLSVSAGGALSPTTSQTTATFDGVTFTFDRAMPVGTFVTGEPFVVSDQAFNITAISPAAADIESDTYVGNGAMKNPYFYEANQQGFDGYLGDYSTKPTYQTPYSAATNIDPAISGNIPLSLGEKATITKSVRDAGKTSTLAQHQTIAKYIHLTVLDTAPIENSYRPGHAGTAKVIRSRADVDFTARAIALPASWPTVASILSDVPDDLGLYTGGEQQRFTRIDNALGTTTDGYSSAVVPSYAQYIYALNSSDTSAAQKQEIIDRIITFANDVESVIDSGGSVNFGAGQGFGIWLWLMAAAAITKDAALLAKALSTAIQPNHPFWVDSSWVGRSVSPSQNVNAQTWFTEHLDTPAMNADEGGSHHDARYFQIAASGDSWEYTAIAAFNQGPPGFADGEAMILNGGALANSNADAAKIGIASRYRKFNIDFMGAYGVGAQWSDAWDDLVTAGAITPWTGQPDQPPMGATTNLDNDYFSAGVGSITLNTQGIDFATETITQTDMRYSLDNVQFVVESNVTLSGNAYTKSSLLRGVPHWCGWRRTSAGGTSPWSANYAREDANGDRSKVTTTGTEANAAPVNTVAPVIHVQPYSGWYIDYWEPASTTLGLDDVVLAAGVGYWSGFPAPDFEGGNFTFQWKRGGVDIAGATSQEYTRVVADAEAILTCELTCTTAQGSASVTTAGVTVPAIQNPPAGTLIDTNFRDAFAIDYSSELSTFAVNNNAQAQHIPGYSDINGVNLGAFVCFKDGGTLPSVQFTLSRAATASTTYNINAQIGVEQREFFFNLGGTTFLEIDNATGDGPFFTGSLVNNSNGGSSQVLDISDTFSIGAGITDLDLIVRLRSSSTGGASDGGDPILSQLTIAEV